MKTSDFDFELPPRLIAQRPADPRESARLLDVRGVLRDRFIRDLPDILEPGSVLVVNDTQVIPAQLSGTRDGSRVGVTLHKDEGGGEWLAFAKPAKRLRPGDVVLFGPDFEAEVVTRDGPEVRLRFPLEPGAFRAALVANGAAPLPPYIKRPDHADARDAEDYQTMFAAREGAVAAPTAGLHFTPDLVSRIEASGASFVSLTLHAHHRLGFRSEEIAAWAGQHGLTATDVRTLPGDRLTVNIWMLRKGADIRALDTARRAQEIA